MHTIKTVVSKGTWQGVPGVCTVYRLDNRRDGLRVCLLELHGQPAVASLVEGDGRRPEFTVHAQGVLPA